MTDRQDACVSPQTRATRAATLLRPRMGWAFELRAILLAMTLAAGGLACVPGSWLLDLEPIEILQNAGEEPFVVHRARLWLPIQRDITYSAEVLEVDSPLSGSPRDTVVCRGVSTWHLPPGELQEVRITLKAWIDDHDCTLRRGLTYYARVVYHFELFGFSKVAEMRTAAVAMPIVRMLVGPTVPPGL